MFTWLPTTMLATRTAARATARRRSLPRAAWAAALVACLALLAPGLTSGHFGTARAGSNITDTHFNLSATVNLPYSGSVAVFTDATTSDTPASFQVLHIDWGDGSALDTSTGSVSGAGGFFAAKGSHTYTTIGHFPLDVQVRYAGATIDLTGTAFVTACTPASTTASPYAQAVLATAPLGFWRLDDATGSGCLADSSGHNLTGMPSAGGLSFGQPGILGDPTAGLGFDGQSGYVSLGDPSSLQPGQVSVEAWIKTTHDGGLIVRKRLYGYNLALNAGGTPTFGIDDSSGTTYNAAGTTSVADGQWHYLVGTYDGSQVCLYVDGTKASCAQAGAIYYQPDAVAIGRDGGAADGYFNGSIADVAIYGRALYPAEIQGLYTAGSAPNAVLCSPHTAPNAYASAVLASAPLGYWRLNETCRGIVSDASGHGLSGMAFSGVTPNQPGPLPGGADASMSFDTPYAPDVELGDPTALQPAQLSVEAWVNTAVFAPPYQTIIVRKRGSGYALYENPYINGGVCGCTAGFSITDSKGTTYAANGTTPIIDGKWHYLVGTYDGSKVCFYLDGVQQSCTPAGTIYYQPDLVAIGQDGSSIPPQQYFTPQFLGEISEVAIYGHALSAAEVQAHYAAALAATTTTLGLSVPSIVAGQPLTLTATVQATVGTPTGTVTFMDGSTALGTGTLTNGLATFNTDSLAVGTHSLTAAYAGAAGFASSMSAAATLLVSQASTTTSVAIQISQGWNLISLPLQPATPLAAHTLLGNVLRASTGKLAALYALNGGGWTLLGLDNQGTVTGQSGTLQPGAGYLLYSDRSASYTLSGTLPTPLPAWQLQAGWNLVGISQGTLAASQAVSSVLHASHGSLAALYRLSTGAWAPPVIAQGNGTPHGSDFTLTPGAGYLLYSDKPATLTPATSSQAAAVRPGVRVDGARPARANAFPALPSLP